MVQREPSSTDRSPPGHESSAGRSFRASLREELPGWRERGWITEDGARAIEERYRLNQVGAESASLVSIAIFAVAALLLGGGAIAFVAANWDIMSPTLRSVALFAALIGLHAGAFVAWARLGWERLGQGLALAGSITFGAGLGLLAQIFQIRAEWYVIFAPWAVGVLALALALRSPLNGLLALTVSFVWFIGYVFDQGSAAFYPALLLLVGVPVAWWLGSPALVTVGFTAGLLALGVEGFAERNESWAMLASLAAGCFLGLGVQELGRVRRELRNFAEPVGEVSVLLLAAVAFAATFPAVLAVEEGTTGGQAWPFVLALVILAGVAALFWSWRSDPPRGERRLVAAGLALTFAMSGLAIALAWRALHGAGGVEDPGLAAVIAANVAAFALALTGIYSGYESERRRDFWLGLLFAVALIVARFFQYNTSLLLKSLIFVAAGLVVLALGVAFERHLSRRGTSSRTPARVSGV